MRGMLLLFTLHLGGEHSGGDRWLSADKVKHFAAAAFVQSVAFSGFRTLGVSRSGSLIAASAVTSAVSVGKEVRDRRSGSEFSTKDLVWDAGGLLGASLLLHRTEP